MSWFIQTNPNRTKCVNCQFCWMKMNGKKHVFVWTYVLWGMQQQ